MASGIIAHYTSGETGLTFDVMTAAATAVAENVPLTEVGSTGAYTGSSSETGLRTGKLKDSGGAILADGPIYLVDGESHEFGRGLLEVAGTLANQLLILQKLNNSTVKVVSPVAAGGTITLIHRNDYSAAEVITLNPIDDVGSVIHDKIQAADSTRFAAALNDGGGIVLGTIGSSHAADRTTITIAIDQADLVGITDAPIGSRLAYACQWEAGGLWHTVLYGELIIAANPNPIPSS